jgi:hypothetical protein
MTSPQQGTLAVAPASRLAALRSNCMGIGVLLIIEFGLGAGINLYVTIPRHKSFFPTVFGSAVLAAHAIVALLLLGSATAALIRAIRARTAIVVNSAGFAAILAAGIAGSTFADSQSNGASLAMALATAVAMFCYLAAVFSLPFPQGRRGGE